MDKKYVLITGGELFNKGAQAMTFTVISKIKKMYPNKEIVLLSQKDYNREPLEKEQYNFLILPWNMQVKAYLLGKSFSTASYLLCKDKHLKYQNAFHNIKYVFENSCLLIDISGYSLSSQVNRRSVKTYISKIILAKKYKIPVWLFPQSFGPFEYTGINRIVNQKLVLKYLNYPKKVFVREKHGLNCLIDFTKNRLQNIAIMPDVVLQSSAGYNLATIFTNEVNVKKEFINNNAVGIVPNKRIFERLNNVQTFEMYKRIIDVLIKYKKTVYILRHSVEDLEICQNLKRLYDDKNIVLLEKDYSCIELERIVSCFDYLIASRYHSIVHAFKKGVPCVSIGWAIKYEELLSTFYQEKYNFMIEGDVIDIDKVLNSVSIMNDRFNKEKRVISSKLKDIQRNDIFKILEKEL